MLGSVCLCDRCIRFPVTSVALLDPDLQLTVTRAPEECEAALLAKGIAGETERGRSQRLDAVWSGEPLGICKAHPTKGAVCLEA